MWALPPAVVCLAVALAGAAFRRGRRRATRRLPPELGAELRAHKLACLGEAPERVDLELRLLLGDEPRRATGARSVDQARHRLAPAGGR